MARRTLLHTLSASLLFLLGGFLLFSSTGRDDAYITYWPAHTLSEYGEILNYNGDRIEQSSSLLQVLLLSVLHATTGGGMADLGGGSAIVFGIVSIFLIYILARRILPQAAFATALLTAISVYFLYWSFSGMETSLVSAVSITLVLSYAHFLETHGRTWTLLLSCCAAALAFVIARPESTILLPAMACSFLLAISARSRFRSGSPSDLQRLRRRGFILLILSLLASAAVLIFRISYFGRLFPQPVYAKSQGLSAEALAPGLNYLRIHLFSDTPTTVLTLAMVFGFLVSAFRQAKLAVPSPSVLFSLLFVFLSTVVIVLVGGDWMEGGRFIAHFLPLGILLLVLGFHYILKAPRLVVPALCITFFLEIWTGVGFTGAMSRGMPLWAGLKSARADELTGSSSSWFELTNRVHLRDIHFTDHLNTIVDRVWRYKKKTVNVMSSQMGLSAYYVSLRNFGHVRFIDRYGLTDRTFSDCAIFDEVPRTPLGIGLAVGSYYSDIRFYLEQCGYAMPDVIYDIFHAPQELDLLSKQGYEIVYLQYGQITAGSERLPGAAVHAEQFIAVRVDLEAALAGIPKEREKFPEIEF